MADETDEIINHSDETESQKRIKQLSEKVELTAKERDELKASKEQDLKKIQELEKENSFNSGFGDILGTHTAAKDHKDEIKAKFSAGYSLEDATLAVLAKAGKLTATTVTPQVAGGSAATTMSQGTQKELKDMSLADKRAVLEKEIMWT